VRSKEGPILYRRRDSNPRSCGSGSSPLLEPRYRRRDSNPSGETAHEAENLAADSIGQNELISEVNRNSEPSPAGPRPPGPPKPELTDSELLVAIADAVRLELVDVARVLAAELQARQSARVPSNVRQIGDRPKRS
jgi:hypothetical protein